MKRPLNLSVPFSKWGRVWFNDRSGYQQNETRGETSFEVRAHWGERIADEELFIVEGCVW
jgi:hypothetical protein